MLVDCTLFVQILHFLLAYLIFTRIFLKPAYRIIVEQRMHRDILERDTADVETINRVYRHRLNRELVQAQSSLMNILPSLWLDEQPVSIGNPVEQCDHASVTCDTEELSTMLVDQVINDTIQ